jgi:hypothetical protein
MREFEKDESRPMLEMLMEEQIFSWKDVLKSSLGKTEKQINSERSWAKLCQRMRDLCPETTWLSICEQSEQSSQILIPSFQSWLESLVATVEWPFPESVILISSGNSKPSVSIIFNKTIHTLPFSPPPKGLSIMACRDEYTHGWLIQPMTSNKYLQIGQA